MSEKSVYVGVPEPMVHRKNLLLCSRDLITCLKNYERLKSVRAEKIERIFELRKMVQEIAVLNRKLRQAMPKVQKAELPGTESTPARKRKQEDTGRSLSKPQVKTKVDLLQKELDRIEKKLRGLE